MFIGISFKYHSNIFIGFRVILLTSSKQTNTVCPPPLAEVIIPPTAVWREALYATPLPLPTRARLQLKTAVAMPHLGQPNVSISSQWIQWWFVWILLINCSHVNYWCGSVRPAFWMTDGRCSRVIPHHHHTHPHASVAELQKDFQFCVFPIPSTSPFSPSLLLCWRLLLTAFDISVISTHTCYHQEISLWLCPFTSCSVLSLPRFFSGPCHFPDISPANFLVPAMSKLRGAPVYSFVASTLPFSFPVFTLVLNKSFTQAGYQLLTQ